MLIIPVVDLSDGIVVHAKYGERSTYQPIKSVISVSAVPEVVLSSFLELYPFKTIYIADLDAIQKIGDQHQLILNLASQFKQCTFWVDAGIDALKNKGAFYTADNIKLVLGSENKLQESRFSSLIDNHPNIILSLDFDDDGLIENPYLLEKTSLWPKQVIVMNLSGVGSSRGINKKRLSNILEISNHRSIFAAGGVRNRNDLLHLSSTPVKGVLVASALHNGEIKKDELKLFS